MEYADSPALSNDQSIARDDEFLGLEAQNLGFLSCHRLCSAAAIWNNLGGTSDYSNSRLSAPLHAPRNAVWSAVAALPL
jgi:hypothetical protein